MGEKLITERIKKIFEKAPNPESRLIIGDYYNEKNDVPFEKFIEYRERTPQINLAIATYRDLIVGTELQINADDPDAKKLIEDWNASTRFFEKATGLVDTVLTCGAGILEKLDENKTEDVLEVDMRTIEGKKRDRYGNLLYYTQYGTTGQVNKLGENRLSKFIEFNLTSYSRQPWGRSLFYSLAVPRTIGNRTTRPLIEAFWAMQDAEVAIMVNHAYPEVFYTFEDVDEKTLEKEAEKIKKRKPGDRVIGVKRPVVDIFETQPSSKYTDFVADISKSIELGTQFPHDIMTGNFTSRAASDTTDNLVMRRVASFKNYFAYKLKTELYEPILTQNGFDPRKVNLTVAFGVPDVSEMSFDQVHKLYIDKAITLDEYRQYLKAKSQSLDLFDSPNFSPNMEKIIKCKMCKEHQHAFCSGRRCKCSHIEQTPSEEDLRRMRAKLLKKLAEKDGIEL